MLKKIFVLLAVLSMGTWLLAAGPAFDNPHNWQANSNGKMTISYDDNEKAIRFNVEFKPEKDLWAYPKIELDKVPAQTQTFSFETRSSQIDDKAGYRCGYVMFAPLKKNIRYQPSSAWQTVSIDFTANKIVPAQIKSLQIGLNPNSPKVTFWIRNMKFLATDSTPSGTTVKSADPEEIRKNIPLQEKWLSPAIPAIAPAIGFFQVKKHDGAWWFVDPSGKPFYSVGVNYCRGVGMDWPPRTQAEYRKTWLEQEPLSRKMSLKYKQWNFNTCGSVGGNWNGRFPATPVFRCLQYADSLAKKGQVPYSKKYKFVDVFSPEFARACDHWAQIVIKPEADNPMIIGWFIDNEFHLPQDEDFQKKFYEVVIAAIRKYDKNHLLLGTRFETPNRSDLDIRMVGRYCDVLSVNYYDYPHNRAALKRLHDVSGGRPLLIGEFTAAAKENGVTNGKYWIGGLFKDQNDRAKGYERYASEIAELPYFIGAHFFMFTDRNEPKLNNWGLRDMDGKLYYDFVRHLAAINQNLPLIHAGKLKPRKFPELKCVANDNPHTTDEASIAPDGSWLWQPAYLHYSCTPGNAPYYFDRISDENWGYRENGFIEYRFTLKKPLADAYMIIRYASLPKSTTNQIKIEVNDDEVAIAKCPKAFENLTVPPGWAYGFSQMKLTTITIPLKTDIPAGITNVRFITEKPWKPQQGIIMQGFFLSAGPRVVDPANYYGLKPVQ